MSLALTAGDRAALDGDLGPATALAMRVVTRTAEAMGAPASISPNASRRSAAPCA